MYLNAWPGDEEDGKQRTATEHHYWVTLEREGMRNVDDTPNKCPQRTEPKEGDTEVTQKGQKKLLVSKPLEVKSLESTGYSKEQSDQKKQGQSYFWGATTEEEVTDGGKKPRTGDSEQSRGRLYTLQRRQQYFWKSRKACFEAIVFYSLEMVLWQSKESSGNSVQALLTSPARHSCPSGNSFFPSFGDSWMNTRRVQCHLYYSLAVKPVKMTFFFGVISLAKWGRHCCML